MFGSTVLAVVLGLVFVYFVFSMACSKVNEVVAAKLQWRADTLEKWLRKSLGTSPHTTDPSAPTLHAEAFKNSTLITPITADVSAKTRLPSYIAPRTFGLAVLDLLLPGEGQVKTMDEVKAALDKLPPGHPAKAPLSRLAIEAGHNLSAFQVGLEGWFNDSMGRVSGWYKRRVQRWMLVYAVAVTILFNVDTLVIARTLWNQDTVRQAVVAQVQGQSGNLDDVSTKVDSVKKLNLPLGWAAEKKNAVEKNGTVEEKITVRNPDPRRWPGADAGALLAKLAGLGITAGALSLGAPFWFDLLGKLARLRSAGERPATSPSPASPVLAAEMQASQPAADVPSAPRVMIEEAAQPAAAQDAAKNQAPPGE